MLRTLKRTLARVDDLAEVLVLATGRALWRQRSLLGAAGGLALLGAALWPHLPACTKSTPRRANSLRVCVPAPRPVAPPRWTVDELDVTVDSNHRAIIRCENRIFKAVPGTVIRSSRGVELVVTNVTCDEVEALRVPSGTTERQSARCIHRDATVKISAIAGERPTFLAVIEYAGLSYIVENGTRIPDVGRPALTVTRVDENRVVYLEHRTGKELTAVVSPEPATPPAPPAGIDPLELDL